MEAFSEKAVARQLKHFDAVWARVDSARSARGIAQAAGRTLMPRKQGSCRQARPCRGR